MARLRLALCQLNAVVGDIDHNEALVLDALHSAEGAGADLAVFPELMLTGYPPEDLLLKPSFVDGVEKSLARIASQCRSTVAVVGYVERDRDLFNAAAVLANGAQVGNWRKQLLPNYGVFDERRWFSPGTEDGALYSIAGVRVGVTICEDAWSPAGPVGRLAAGGAELIVSLNASPYRKDVFHERERMLATRAADSSCALAYVNLVGGQDELIFDGASMVFDANGSLVFSAEQFVTGVHVIDLELGEVYRHRILDPRGHLISSELPVIEVTPPHDPPGDARVSAVVVRPEPEAEVYNALVLATHDYVEKNGFGDVVIGLSGGIDSALVAAIAVDALGAERVHGVAMPSRYSSSGSLADAAALAESLHIDFRTISIEPAFDAFLSSLQNSFGDREPDLTEENIQSRVRGTLLMALSNKFGWLVLTTGNKSEIAVGYATLYGDMAGGFAVIRDVPKTLVYRIVEYRNGLEKRALIPQQIIDKPPSAELRPDQKDIDSLPAYEVLDPIIECYVEKDLSLSEIIALGYDEAVVRRVITLIDRAEYKRRQAPPGGRVTSRAFGKDRRMPITNRFSPSR
jgi:NAD+ synthase (glutamine-hydrolysing)